MRKKQYLLFFQKDSLNTHLYEENNFQCFFSEKLECDLKSLVREKQNSLFFHKGWNVLSIITFIWKTILKVFFPWKKWNVISKVICRGERVEIIHKHIISQYKISFDGIYF